MGGSFRGERRGGGVGDREVHHHLSRSDEEIDAGHPREEEDHASNGKANSIPEVIKDPRFSNFG